MAHRNITFVICDLLFMHCLGSSPPAEGDISPSARRERTTSHPHGFSPSCQGTLSDPEGPKNPMP